MTWSWVKIKATMTGNAERKQDNWWTDENRTIYGFGRWRANRDSWCLTRSINDDDDDYNSVAWIDWVVSNVSKMRQWKLNKQSKSDVFRTFISMMWDSRKDIASVKKKNKERMKNLGFCVECNFKNGSTFFLKNCSLLFNGCDSSMTFMYTLYHGIAR